MKRNKPTKPQASASNCPRAHASSRSPRSIDSLASLLLGWFREHARLLPWRETQDPYAIWVSEIMLQQTQVATVIPFWKRWMRELPCIEDLAMADSNRIHKLWEGLGYYTRVRNMQAAARQMMELHNGRFPTLHNDILNLPGVGRYTAGAICSIAFNQPTPILDGNVIRVLTRLFGIRSNPRERKTNARLWNLAGDFVRAAARTADEHQAAGNPVNACSHLNQSLMELGALVCTPRQPRCSNCPVAAHCIAHKKNLVDRLPNLGSRAPATARRFAAFLIQKNGAFLVRQRPAGVVNAHLWEFPNAELCDDEKLTDVARRTLRLAPKALNPLCTIRHSITRYRITLDAFTVEAAVPSRHSARDGRWLAPNDLVSLPFSSAHKKVLNHLV